jgi:signal transduction histidine kinase/CheY-like chemotaxis protein
MMKRLLIIVYTTFLIIMVANYIYYKSLYYKQISYIVELLERRVQIVGLAVDNTNNGFISDLNQISFSEDLALFFSNPENRTKPIERMKLFFSKYQDFVTGIKMCDNNKNEFTLKKESDEWLEQPFVLHVQSEIFDREKLVQKNRKFNYYLPVLDKKNETIGNIVVTVDYQKYFSEIFTVFNLKDYQWQWVVSDSGQIIYDNNGSDIQYKGLERITKGIDAGSISNFIHDATIKGKHREIISAYYSTQLLQREMGLVFSAQTDFFQKSIIRNSLFIVLGTLFLIQMIIFLFWRYIKAQKAETDRLESSEKMLFKLIEEMPVGVIIHNKNREIIKANGVAAEQYSYADESEMLGRIFPETSLPRTNDYFSANPTPAFNSEQFVLIKKEIGETVLFRNSIEVVFKGEEATMEILIDVTMLESARKQEVKANVAKSEFLARMSYEIRTPLNGIIGMTDVLNKHKLTPETEEIVSLLHRSTEVLLNIVNDILDFSRIESGRMILEEIPFNLRDEIDFCVNLAKTSINRNNPELVYSVDENIPERVIGDPFRLRQILTNLLNHSVRNTEKGKILLSCFIKGNKNGIITLYFELSDTGIYFDQPTLKKIFGNFVDIESKSARIKDDSGFGTILSNQLVGLMGGELKAESPSGLSGTRGTKVSFTIQSFSGERLKKDLTLEKVNTYEKIKALVISGSQNRDEETLGSLHKKGLTVSITTYQKSTLNQIKANLNFPEERYNLVIIFDDADFNGFNVARILWENNLSNSFIMFIISSNDKKGNYMNCITLGIDHYFIKPFDINDLLSVLTDSFPYIENNHSGIESGRSKSDFNLLIVEDNKMNQKVMGTMLKSLGYSFDLADDGHAGYLLAKNKKYDIIFMDLILPEMDGFESSRKILEMDKSALIVAFTADNQPESRRKAELSGIKDFISKPVRMEDLKRLFTRYFYTAQNDLTD